VAKICRNVSNPYLGWRYDVGPSGFDRTHNAVVNFIYDIPLFRNNSSRLVKTALGGWQASGIVTIESGLPLNIGISGKQGGNALPNATNRPDLVGKSPILRRRSPVRRPSRASSKSNISIHRPLRIRRSARLETWDTMHSRTGP